MVDPNEGTALKFISAPTINGVRCDMLKNGDVAAKIEQLKQSILCTVLGANTPFEVMQGFIKRIWSTLDIDKIIQVRKGVFLVRFGNLQDKHIVERRGHIILILNPFLSKDGTQIWT